MQVLSYGFKRPDDGDAGSIWFPALYDCITQLNSHDHDGTDSALITSAYIQKGTVTVSSGSWSSISTGKYRQLVTVPSGFNMSDFSITTYLSTGDLIHPTIEKVSSTTFYIYTLDNTLTYTVVFR